MEAEGFADRGTFDPSIRTVIKGLQQFYTFEPTGKLDRKLRDQMTESKVAEDEVVPVPAVRPSTARGDGGNIAWGRRVTSEFLSKVVNICDRLECNPSHLMALMAFETAGTFSPSLINRASGSAGLL